MCYCTVFALFSFEFEGNFRVQAPGGLWRGDLSKGFFCITSLGGGGFYLEGLLNGEVYFQNFTVCLCLIRPCCLSMIFQIEGDL